MYVEVKSCLDYSIGKKSFNTESILNIKKDKNHALKIEFNSFNDVRYEPPQNESVLFFENEAKRDEVYNEIIKAMGGLKNL